MTRNFCAIIYTSNTGFTARYAALLGEAVQLPFYTLEEAGNALPKGACVFYMGWLMAGKISGLAKARRHFRVLAAAAVGVAPDCETATLQSQNKATELPMFYLQGGFDKTKLTGVHKLAMAAMEKGLAAKGKQDPAANARAQSLRDGFDCVSSAHLAEIVGWMGQ